MQEIWQQSQHIFYQLDCGASNSARALTLALARNVLQMTGINLELAPNLLNKLKNGNQNKPRAARIRQRQA